MAIGTWDTGCITSPDNFQVMVAFRVKNINDFSSGNNILVSGNRKCSGQNSCRRHRISQVRYQADPAVFRGWGKDVSTSFLKLNPSDRLAYCKCWAKDAMLKCFSFRGKPAFSLFVRVQKRLTPFRYSARFAFTWNLSFPSRFLC